MQQLFIIKGELPKTKLNYKISIQFRCYADGNDDVDDDINNDDVNDNDIILVMVIVKIMTK